MITYVLNNFNKVLIKKQSFPTEKKYETKSEFTKCLLSLEIISISDKNLLQQSALIYFIDTIVYFYKCRV